MKIAPILILFIITIFTTEAQEIEKKKYSAKKAEGLLTLTLNKIIK